MASKHDFDLIVRDGRVLDPARGWDGAADVAFRDGRVAAVGPRLGGTAAETRDATGLVVVPGLIDLHTHVYWGGTAIGIDADAVGLRSGTTTFVDAGTAGPANFPGFRRHVIETSRFRILAYLNVSFAGIFAFSPTVMVGECENMALLDAAECVRVARDHAEMIVGIKVRVGRNAGGGSGVAPLDVAIQVAEELDLPVMAHIDRPPPVLRDVLERLRPGDVLTHCFRPFPNSVLVGGRGIREEVSRARERGVLFDIGHGFGSFAFSVAEETQRRGFAPDVISSDVHVLNVNGPVYDLLVTLSKFHCLGMSLDDVVARATVAPARAIGRPDLGRLDTGAVGDAALLEVSSGEFAYVDALGEVFRGKTKLHCRGLVREGAWLDASDP